MDTFIFTVCPALFFLGCGILLVVLAIKFLGWSFKSWQQGLSQRAARQGSIARLQGYSDTYFDYAVKADKLLAEVVTRRDIVLPTDIERAILDLRNTEPKELETS